MPIYEYECRKCKAHTEAMQKMTDKPLSKCPKCGGRLEKQWSSTSFQLKGSGWYVTDYAGKKTTEAKEESKKPDAKEEKKSSAEATASTDKATPKETTSSKKTSSSKTAPSSGD
jgi:putative FmdB family regulatory protein